MPLALPKVIWALSVSIAAFGLSGTAARAAKPTMDDFMGLNGHSVLFYPTLYDDVASNVRDYHQLSWDITANDSSGIPNFNKTVNWTNIYDSWADQGFRINTAIQFNNADLAGWGSGTTFANAAKAYGRAFAQKFGSVGSGNNLVKSVQIGNEPGDVSDDKYRTLFINMAQGIREVDPNLKIVTANVAAGPSTEYTKTLDLFNDSTIRSLVDVYATHTYAFIQGWPTWERTHPEDTRAGFTYRSQVQDIINWRNTNDTAAKVWVTEFGYDASTQPPPTSGTFKDFKDVTDTQQARYITRSFLTFANMDIDKAYMYWANDDDEPTLHASSGLTRNYNPKPSYHAMAHLNATLGDYRFKSAVTKLDGNLYVYAFEKTTNPNDLIWAIWSPTGTDRLVQMTLDHLPGTATFADMMPLASGAAPLVSFTQLDADSIRLMVGESPIYLRISAVPEPGTMGVLAIAFLALINRRRRI